MRTINPQIVAMQIPLAGFPGLEESLVCECSSGRCDAMLAKNDSQRVEPGPYGDDGTSGWTIGLRIVFRDGSLGE